MGRGGFGAGSTPLAGVTKTDLAQKQFNIKWIAVSGVVWHSGQIGFAWPPRLIMMPAVSCLFCWTVANGSFQFEVTKSKYRTLIYLWSVSIYETLPDSSMNCIILFKHRLI